LFNSSPQLGFKKDSFRMTFFFRNEFMSQKDNLLTRMEDFIVWFAPHIENFPRNHKFLFGDRAVEILLDILEDLADAYYSKNKSAGKLEKLERANLRLEKFRRLLSVCMRLKFINAAPYRDRVVHHALINIIGPLFEKKFIRDSYANQTSKGTHVALERCTHYARRYRYVWQLDMRKYFPSLDHQILLAEIARTKI